MLNSRDPVWNIRIKWVNCRWTRSVLLSSYKEFPWFRLYPTAAHWRCFEELSFQRSAPIPVFLLVSPHASSVLFVPLHWGVCSCVLAATQPRARMRAPREHFEDVLDLCVYFPGPVFPVRLSVITDVWSWMSGCFAPARACAGEGGGWGGEEGKGGVCEWIRAGLQTVREWEYAKLCSRKNTPHTLFADPRTHACILHAFAGVFGVENPLADIHTTPGSSVFIILPKRTIKISSVRRNL